MKNSMNRINRFFGQHTFLAAIVMTTIMLGTRALVSAMMRQLPAVQNDTEVHTVAVVIVYYVIPLAFAIAFGYGWIFGKGKFFKTMGIGSVMVMFAMFQFTMCLGRLFANDPDLAFVDESKAIGGLIKIIGIGFFEEVVFRGIVANKLGRKYGHDAKGVWLAAVLSSVLFGLVHMQNIFYGAHFIPTLVQSVVAAATGLMLVAIYYRGGSIYAMILIHAMIDIGPLFASTFTTQDTVIADAINELQIQGMFLAIPMVILAVWLMRKSRMPEIIENIQKEYPRVSEFKHHKTTLRQRIEKLRSGNNKGLLLQV